MAERTLIEAFHRDVLSDPGFMAAVDGASGLEDMLGGPSLSSMMRRGLFSGAWEQWPISLTAERMLDAWFYSPEGGAEYPTASGILHVQREASEETLDQAWPLAVQATTVFRRFLEPLYRGTAQAWGEARPGDRQAISQAVWHRRSTLIDPLHGDVGRIGDDGGFERQWSAVTLIEAGPPAIGANPAIRSRGGRPSDYSWDIAFNSAFTRMLTGDMPSSGKDFARWIEAALERVDGRSPGLDYIEQVARRRCPDLWGVLTQPGKRSTILIPRSGKGG